MKFPVLGTRSLPPLGGRLLAVYRIAWFGLLAAALAASVMALTAPGPGLVLDALRLAKAAALIAVSAILLRRRPTDAVAALLALSLLLWVISSSVDFAGSAAVWPLIIDRCRFLLFALAVLLFPDGGPLSRWTLAVAAAIVLVFVIGLLEAVDLLPPLAYLPLAIGCVLLALAALLDRYRRATSEVQKQQHKWVGLGLVGGIALILSARTGAYLTTGMAMPLIGILLLEGLFQLGIVAIALGFLTALLRHRLYDADTAISRSAGYVALTLTLVATFAACEALIELVGQRYFGSGIGDISGAVAAAIAAVMLSPLHDRISRWADEMFQRDLNLLKRDMPDLLLMLWDGASLRQFGAAALPSIAQAVNAARIALWIEETLVVEHGSTPSSPRSWRGLAAQASSIGLLARRDDPDYPLWMVLCDSLGKPRGWLLLGPRPDGSFYGKAELAALAEIWTSLRQPLLYTLAREARDREGSARVALLASRIADIEIRLGATAPANNGDSRPPNASHAH